MKHYKLSSGSINSVYNEVAKPKFKDCLRLVENLGCEFLREIKDPMSFWDEDTVLEAQQKRVGNGKVKYPDLFYST